VDRRNLAKNMWGGVGGFAKSTMGIRGQVRKREIVGLNQSLIYIHKPYMTPFFFLFSCPSLTQYPKRLFLGRNNIGKGYLSPLHQFAPMGKCVSLKHGFNSRD